MVNIMKKIKLTKKQLLIYLIIFVIFLTLSNAKGYSVSPFGFGALFALMWTGVNIAVLSGEYLIANIVLMDSFADIYSAITTVFILLVVYFIHKRIKKPMNVALVGIYALLSQLVSLYYVNSIGGWFDCLIFAFVGLVFLYVCINVFQIIALRGWFYKLTLDETICLIVLIIVLTFGIAEIYIYDSPLYKAVAVFAVLLSVNINKKNFSIIVAIAIGLGVAITTSSLSPIGELSVIAIASNIFSYPHRYRIAFATLIGDIVLQMYFVGLEYKIIYYIIPTIFSIVCFLSIPSKVMEKVVDKYLTNNAEFSVRNVISSTRKNIKHRMGELSDVFAQMSQIHLKLIKQEFSKEQIVLMLSQELSKSLCGECVNKNYCYKGFGLEGVAYVNNLIEIALKKGKISVLDLHPNMMQKCNIVNLIIGKLNQLVGQYQEYNTMLKDVNNVKFLLAEQMNAVSQLLQDLGEEMDSSIAFDNSMHNKILNNLLSNNIVCSEVLMFTEKGKDVSVVVIVKGENAYNPNIENIISKSIKCPMTIVEIEPTDLKDYYSIRLCRACKRDVAFGISNITKSGSVSSGDSHSLIRLGNNKYLLALCDGMGSGENARKMSSLTMGLIENFYRAGFDDGFILNNVNKLLTVTNQENFSTLDLCVIDLDKEMMDFIKLGAPYGVIKREQCVDKIETGTLPLGVLGQIKPNISHFAISAKDMVIMVTDGISDAFRNYEDFAQFVNSVTSINPQVVAQTILDEAIKLNGGTPKDDMTVLVARTFLKG